MSDSKIVLTLTVLTFSVFTCTLTFTERLQVGVKHIFSIIVQLKPGILPVIKPKIFQIFQKFQIIISMNHIKHMTTITIHVNLLIIQIN